jgi:hypothetical protein
MVGARAEALNKEPQVLRDVPVSIGIQKCRSIEEESAIF